MNRTAVVLIVVLGLGGFGVVADGGTVADQVAAALTQYEAALHGAEVEYLAKRIQAHKAFLAHLEKEGREALGEGGAAASAADEARRNLRTDRARHHLLLPPGMFSVEGEDFERKMLRNAATAFSNRRYVWRAIPKRFDRWGFLQVAGGDTPSITLTVIQAGVIFATSAVPEELSSRGWTVQREVSWTYSDRGNSRVTLVSREAREGEVISIPHFSWTGTIVLVPSAGGE